MKVVVTGGSGYLGAYITRHFADRGDDVVVLSRDPSHVGGLNDRFQMVTADIAAPSSLVGTFAEADLVVHAAALNAQECAADPTRAVEVNGLGTRNVLDAAVEQGVSRVVYVSTLHVYGRTSGRIDESSVTQPTSAYGISKLLGEGFCHETLAAGRAETLVARPANGFGVPLTEDADCWMLAIPDFCEQAYRTGSIVLSSAGTQQRVLMSLADIAEAIGILARAPAPQATADSVYNVGAAGSMSIRALAHLAAEECAQVYGRAIDVRVPEDSLGLAEEPPLEYRFDRLAGLGFSPQLDLRSTVAEVATYVMGRQGS